MPTYTPTTKYGLRWLTGSNIIGDIDAGFQTLAGDVEANMTGYLTGTFVGKPTPNKEGRIYRCTDTGQVLFDNGSAWVELTLKPGLVSSLPGSPYDGQEIHYSADPTNGVVWHLRYRSASGSAYKWEFVGGSDAYVSDDSLRTVSSVATPVDIGNPHFTLPLAGDYRIEYGLPFALLTGGTYPGAYIFAGDTSGGVYGGAAGPSYQAGIYSRISNTNSISSGVGGPTMIVKATGVVAGRVACLKLMSADQTSVSWNLTQPWMSIRPVRVG